LCNQHCLCMERHSPLTDINNCVENGIHFVPNRLITHKMEVRRFITILDKYLPLIPQTEKAELLHTLALVAEEEGDLSYAEVKVVLNKHGCEMPDEMKCKECMTDSNDTILGCEWCGRYFHSRCSKYNDRFCSKQCEKIDVRFS